MPYLVNKMTYPTHKIDEVVKTTLEMIEKNPPDESLIETLAMCSRRTDKGIEFIGIFNIKEGKFEKAFEDTNNNNAMYFHIEGVETQTEIWSTMEESFAMVGQKKPDVFLK